MDFFDILTLFGGLALFLFGMNLMGDALERRAGSSLRNFLSRLTGSKVKGFLTGLGVTSVIQSSSATTVMVVGFVNSGIMTLRQAINVIMGANVGTTVTAWILSLSGIDSSNFFVQLLKPMSFTPVLGIIGVAFTMFAKSSKKRDTGTILLGFTTLMFGMDIMSGAVAGLKDVPEFAELLLLFTNPLLGVLAGAILTAVIQSSSASVGILQALCVTGKVTYGAALPIIFGQNIGTCVTAILSSFGANKNAKRAATVHLLFNILGTALMLCIFIPIKYLLEPAILAANASEFGIAVLHSAFNIICTAVFLPMTSLFEKAAMKLIPDAKKPETVDILDERLLNTPSLGLQRCRELTLDMARTSSKAFLLSLETLSEYSDEKAETIREYEAQSDKYEDMLGSYLVKLSARGIGDEESTESAKLLRLIGDFERISDHAVNLLESAVEIKEKSIELTDSAKGELSTLSLAVKEIVELSLAAFENDDITSASAVEPLEEVIDKLKEKLRANHISRLQKGSCSIEAGFVWSDMLTNLERTSDHCSNIAGCILDTLPQDLGLHRALDKARHDDPNFKELYKSYSEKYAV